MSTSLFLQSERLDISVGDAKLPAAMLNIFNTVIILILIPIMDLIVYPLLAKFDRSPTHLQRIGNMSLIVRKLVFKISYLVRHNPGCTAKEDGQRLEISDLGSRGILLSV